MGCGNKAVVRMIMRCRARLRNEEGEWEITNCKGKYIVRGITKRAKNDTLNRSAYPYKETLQCDKCGDMVSMQVS